MYNKRLIIIIITSIVAIIALMIIIQYSYYINSNKSVYDSYRNTALNNNWATSDDFAICDKNYDDSCIYDAFKLIDAGIKDSLNSIGALDKTPNDDLNKASSLIVSGKYRDSLEPTNSAVSSALTTEKSQADSLKEIEDISLAAAKVSGAKVTDKQIRVGWAVVSMTAPNTDPTVTILELGDQGWKVFYGPATGLNTEDLSASGIPDEIINIAENGVPKTKDEINN